MGIRWVLHDRNIHRLIFFMQQSPVPFYNSLLGFTTFEQYIFFMCNFLYFCI